MGSSSRPDDTPAASSSVGDARIASFLFLAGPPPERESIAQPLESTI
jgi:hypothetical protein